MPHPDELQQEIVRLQNQVAQLRNKAALGELLGTTTHEFNNILMTVINYAKMGIRHKDEPTRDKALEKILAAGERAATITRNVLGMAKNRSVDFGATDLAQLIEQTMLLLQREMQQYRITVEVDPGQDIPNVRAIGNQIQQVLMNFLINARQAMKSGGRILIRLQHDQEKQAVALSVRDFGEGIPEATLPKIFDSYFTTKSGPDESGKGGTGLGLAACKEVIEQHGGRIRVDSTVGKGTMFTIMLPVFTDANSHQPSADGSNQTTPQSIAG